AFPPWHHVVRLRSCQPQQLRSRPIPPSFPSKPSLYCYKSFPTNKNLQSKAMFRRSGQPQSKLSTVEMRKLEHLWSLVDRTTSEACLRGDELNQQIAEELVLYPNQTIVYEVIRKIRKKFKSNSPIVMLRALDVAGCLMLTGESSIRREVGSEKFVKWMGKLCKIQRTRTDPQFRGVAHRAQDLIQLWAEESSGGSKSAFRAAYEGLKADGVVFKDAHGERHEEYVSIPIGHAGPSSAMGGAAVHPDAGYNEDVAVAAAIESSLNYSRAGQSTRESPPLSPPDQPSLLSMVPPSVEALMDIIEASSSLAELHDSPILPDVLGQCRELRRSAISRVERMAGSDREEETAQFLKAHDDLDAVLSYYDRVMSGEDQLPMAGGAGSGGAGGGHRSTAAVEERKQQSQNTDLLDLDFMAAPPQEAKTSQLGDRSDPFAVQADGFSQQQQPQQQQQGWGANDPFAVPNTGGQGGFAQAAGVQGAGHQAVDGFGGNDPFAMPSTGGQSGGLVQAAGVQGGGHQSVDGFGGNDPFAMPSTGGQS
ncbi:unnamed protein product, partial [Chrysoparadoxa australica]